MSIDIDECVGGLHSCSPDAYCHNTKGFTAVHVNLDSLAVEENARVSITLRMLSKGGGFSNLILSDKTKTTFIISRTVRKGDLTIHCCFYRC